MNTQNSAIISLFFVLAACSQSEPGTKTGDMSSTDSPITTTKRPSVDTDTYKTCFTEVQEVFPADGATGVYYRDPVRVELSREDANATLRVLEDGAYEVPGVTTVEGMNLAWAGPPLSPETVYFVEVTHNCGRETSSFTTSEIGYHVSADLAGSTYAFDAAGAQWVLPVGVDILFGLVFQDYRLLLEVQSEAADEIQFLGGVGFVGVPTLVQDQCVPTFDLSGDWEDPYFVLEVAEMSLAGADFDFLVTDATVTGSFASDGSRIAGGTLTGNVDTRNLAEAFGLPPGPNAVCDLLLPFGAICTPCASDGVPYCLDMQIRSAEALLVPQLALVEIDEAAAMTCN